MRLSPNIAVLLFGVASGLPFSITGTTLQAWAVTQGVSLEEVGLYALFGIPYVLKFLWAPLLDRFRGHAGVPSGRRRGAIFLTQVAIIPLLILCSFSPPASAAGQLAVAAFVLTIFSATLDLSIDAYRAEILPVGAVGRSASLGVLGYRVGMFLSGAGALIVAGLFGFEWAIRLVALVMALLLFVPSYAPEPDSVDSTDSPQAGSPRAIPEGGGYFEAFTDLLRSGRVGEILLIALLYRAGDMLLSAMTVPFLIQQGFALEAIGSIQKGFGVAATVIGTAAAAVLLPKITLRSAMVWLGVLQGASSLSYLFLVGNTGIFALSVVVFIENFSGGIGTAAFITYFMSVSRGRFTGTQFAVLSSLMGLSRVVVSSTSGFLAAVSGWELFIVVSAVLGVVGAGCGMLVPGKDLES